MWGSLSTWLDAPTLADPVQRRQAPIAQVFMLVLLAGCALAVPLALDGPSAQSVLFDLLAIGTVAAGAGIGLVLLWRERFRLGVGCAIVGFLLALGNLLTRSPVYQNADVALMASLPIVLSGLLLGRRSLVACAIVVAALLCAVTVSGVVRVGPDATPQTQGPWLFMIIVAVLALFLDRFGSTLRQALRDALARERELEALKESLEGAVAARTAELQATVDQLQASQATIRELGAPVLPVLPGVLVAPIIGAIDTARAADLSAAVLAAVDRTRARQVILDITGVPVVDTHVARALLRLAQAARLLGAEALLVGVSVEVAQTMVALGVDLGGLQIFQNLQEAVAALLETQVGAAAGPHDGAPAPRN